MNTITSKKKKTSVFNRFLNTIEKVGNKMPHPISLFGILALVIILLSALFAYLGFSATGEILDPATMEITNQTVNTVSLLSREGLGYIISHAISNFTNYAPLGVVLVCMLGVGCAEGSGYLSALLVKAVEVTPAFLVTPMIVFLGIMSNIATDVGYVLLIPIGALIFMAYGRHPLAGLAAAFSGVSGGFSANLIIGPVDTIMSSITTEATSILDPGYQVAATSNWYFLFISTFLITVVGTFVTNKIVEPRLGSWGEKKQETTLNKLNPQEQKALKYANLTLLALVIIVVAAAFPQNSFLRNADTGSLISGSPFMDGLVFLIAVLFFVPSVVYGRVAGSFKSEKDVCAQMGISMETMGLYIALSFVAAQFINYFNYSKLGTIFALQGASILEKSGIGGIPLFILFILLVSVINLFMGSASAKWTIMAPVFVPMFMLLGYSPELTQIAYRIGDSCTNLISPLMSYFAMIIVYAKKYDDKAGMGTIISTMLPYSLAYLVGWSILLVVWMIAGLPLGIGGSLYY